MKPDKIKITTHERIDTKENELCRGKMGLDGNHLRGHSWVGYVPENSGYVLCSECALQEYDESHISENYDGIVESNDEWDYPGAFCDKCHKHLDTYLLVYKSNHSELWHKLVWNEQLGQLQDPIVDDEKLAKIAENQAYENGYQEGATIENEITQAEAENNPHTTEYPTDMAHYSNVVAPELRAISGFIDSGGHGTYQDAFRDISYHVFNEGVSPSFHAGYYDRILNNREKWDSREKHTFED